MQELSRILLIAGVVLLVAGVVVFAASKLGLGRLPGDIVIRRENVTCFFPIATSIILSIILTLLLWLFRR